MLPIQVKTWFIRRWQLSYQLYGRVTPETEHLCSVFWRAMIVPPWYWFWETEEAYETITHALPWKLIGRVVKWSLIWFWWPLWQSLHLLEQLFNSFSEWSYNRYQTHPIEWFLGHRYGVLYPWTIALVFSAVVVNFIWGLEATGIVLLLPMLLVLWLLMCILVIVAFVMIAISLQLIAKKPLKWLIEKGIIRIAWDRICPVVRLPTKGAINTQRAA